MATGEPVRHLGKPSHSIRSALRPSGAYSGLMSGMTHAWSMVAYLVSGIVIWGGAGLVLDRALGLEPVFLVLGVLVGHAAGVYLIYVRWSEQEGSR